MMIDFKSLVYKYNIEPIGVIQLGVHYFQEKETFVSMGINNFILVEPLRHAFQIMQSKVNDINAKCFNVAVSNFEGKEYMYCDTSNKGQSSSLLNPKRHIEKYPNIKFDHSELVDVVCLKNLDFDRQKYNILVMDLQGNELNALHGAGDLLKTIDCIHTEVNFIEMYEGCSLITELDTYLSGHGFKRVETGVNINNQGWSDAFYIKK